MLKVWSLDKRWALAGGLEVNAQRQSRQVLQEVFVEKAVNLKVSAGAVTPYLQYCYSSGMWWWVGSGQLLMASLCMCTVPMYVKVRVQFGMSCAHRSLSENQRVGIPVNSDDRDDKTFRLAGPSSTFSCRRRPSETDKNGGQQRVDRPSRFKSHADNVY